MSYDQINSDNFFVKFPNSNSNGGGNPYFAHKQNDDEEEKDDDKSKTVKEIVDKFSREDTSSIEYFINELSSQLKLSQTIREIHRSQQGDNINPFGN